MTTLRVFVLVVSLFVMSGCQESVKSHADSRPATIPPELVGEWVSPGAEFDGDYLKRGGALYLDSNGFAAIVGAPPPIGMVGTATYDAKTFTLRLDLHDRGSPPMVRTMEITYDPKAKTLTTEAKPDDGVEKGTFTHRRKEISQWIRDQTK
jgi:hypothetical protein